MMHYTYVLLSEADGRFYIGATEDLKRRVKEHEVGRVESTAYRRPVRLVYYEACLTRDDAFRRERYLKSGRGGRYLRQRLASSLSSFRDIKLERH
jgi:putative endonuclease